MTTNALNWSSKLNVASISHSRRLQGDKITLPQSALEGLLAAAPIVSVQDQRTQTYTSNFDPFNPYSFAAERHAREALADRQQQLPHPLTFRLVNPQNGRAVYAGIREFSADEGEAGLSTFLLEALGLQGGLDSGRTSRSDTPNGDVVMTETADKIMPAITIQAKQLAKGRYVRLRPLEAGYDPEDWKSLLERYLRDNFTTLTNGEILDVPGARHEHFRFLVDKFEPEGEGICIVDTDLEVDIEALNEEQARETLNQKLAKAKRAPGTAKGSSAGGLAVIGQSLQGQVIAGEYVDYELKDWDRTVDLEVKLETMDEADLDVLASPFAPRQRSKPRVDEHVFADLGGQAMKRMKLSHTNVEIEEAESILISVHAPVDEITNSTSPVPLQYTLTISRSRPDDAVQDADVVQPGEDEVRCKNCRQIIPKRTLPLHEAFCYRNNIACPKCGGVFLKNSDSWKNHWHCPHDDDFGSGTASKNKHDSIYHPPSPIKCSACDFEAFNIPILAQHRTSTCPGKEILCQFCHLIVPQQGPDDPSFTDPEVLLSGLTPHELADGARTTECHLCSKIVRLRDMRTHMRLHDRDRITKPKPTLCTNGICGRTIKSGKELQSKKEQMSLCDDCYGPLHSTTYDPEGKSLRRRTERRLLQQLMGGCNKPHCGNANWCRTGRKNATGQDVVMTAKDALPIVKPVIEALARGETEGLRFCVDEAAQSRRAIAEMIAAEGVYELEWCVKALEEERNNINKTGEWLRERAPKKGEVVK